MAVSAIVREKADLWFHQRSDTAVYIHTYYKKDLQGTEVARSWKHYTLERKADRDDNLQETKDVT